MRSDIQNQKYTMAKLRVRKFYYDRLFFFFHKLAIRARHIDQQKQGIANLRYSCVIVYDMIASLDVWSS